MSLAKVLPLLDTLRAQRTLEMLQRHRPDRVALTGGLAIEICLLHRGIATELRPLSDIDFLVASFDNIPKSLAADLLFRHVHPNDPPAKTLLQAVHPETGVRVDFFRSYGSTMSRTTLAHIAGTTIRTVSLEDLTARTARLCMDLATSLHTPRKHTRDFLRLLPLVDPKAMQPIWIEHRKPNHPESFAQAAHLLLDLIPAKPELQIVSAYSQDVTATCPRCKTSQAFPIANPQEILSILGYC